MMKNEKGITLIALVITVIVMLILAGVAITTLINDGGLFDKTLKSADTFENASQKEAKQLEDLMNEIDGYIGELAVDKKAPSLAKLSVSNITENGFTLIATAKDDTGIAKYEFYIKNSDGTFTLEKMIESEDTTVTYNVTGKVMNGNTYIYKLKVYDKAGNIKESSEFLVEQGPEKLANVAKIGDYVEYDAGVWTNEDINKITDSAGNPTVHSTVNDTTAGNQALPTVQGEFGGFELEQSRNTSSKEFNDKAIPRTDGWIVWEINNTTGVVTLISAGHPESYYHSANQSSASINILKSRDCTMYVNEYATEAHILTGEEAVAWYNARFGTKYTIVENGTSSSSTFWGKTFTTDEPISVFENASCFWLASAYNSSSLYRVRPGSRDVSNNESGGYGVRILISLKADVLLEQTTSNGTVDKPWKIFI